MPKPKTPKKSVKFDDFLHSESGKLHPISSTPKSERDSKMTTTLGFQEHHERGDPSETHFTPAELRQFSQEGRAELALEKGRERQKELLKKWDIVDINEDGTVKLCNGGKCMLIALAGWTIGRALGVAGGKTKKRKNKQRKTSKNKRYLHK
jgi:hypothetical protein